MFQLIPTPHPPFVVSMRHITNTTNLSNRTIDYIANAKPEAYQAHCRRVSATKVANRAPKEASGCHETQKQSQQETTQGTKTQNTHEDLDAQQMENMTLHRNAPSPTSSTYGLHSDLDSGLPVDLRQHQPKFNDQHPNSAPAILNSFDKKNTITQGEIQIGIEPALSPPTGVNMRC